MRIVILRHGKVNRPPGGVMSSVAFANWVRTYNANGLDPTVTPPDDTCIVARSSHAVVCSRLRRSLESAATLGVDKVTVSDAIFNEAGLPAADNNRLKLYAGMWLGIFRLAWFAGYANNSETLREARARASKATKLLIGLCEQHQSVLLIGHGVLNGFIAKELKASGWQGTRRPNRKYWGYSVYEAN